MSMSVGESDSSMMDINTTPLIDVMLCLLILLIMTLPKVTDAVKLDMPRPTATPTQARVEGRSPSITATTTGTTAATAAVVGATAAASPRLSPANMNTKPKAPEVPAPTPRR